MHKGQNRLLRQANLTLMTIKVKIAYQRQANLNLIEMILASIQGRGPMRDERGWGQRVASSTGWRRRRFSRSFATGEAASFHRGAPYRPPTGATHWYHPLVLPSGATSEVSCGIVAPWRPSFSSVSVHPFTFFTEKITKNHEIISGFGIL